MKKYGVRCMCCNPGYIFKPSYDYNDYDGNDTDYKFGTDDLNEVYRFFSFCYTEDPNIEVFEKHNG